MRRTLFPILIALPLLAGCADLTAERTMVKGTGPDELLKLRSGPGLGFKIILGLPEGTALHLRDCVTEVGQLWCEVSLAATPGIVGYVSADYLSNT